MCWQRCLDLDPTYLDAYAKMADVCKRRGEWEKAESHLRKYLELAPNSADLVAELGDVLLQQGQAEQAIRLLEDAPRQAFDDSRAATILGQAYLQLLCQVIHIKLEGVQK